MKRSNTELFRCLCHDTGMCYVDKNIDLELLDQLRKELLESTSDKKTEQDRNQWTIKFNRLFSTSYSWEDVERPAVFRDIYQVLSFLSKIPVPVTDKMRNDYVTSFLETEKETKAWRVDRSNPVSRFARFLTRIQSDRLDLSPDNIQTLGRHGPGAVYESLAGSDKNWFRYSSEQLDRYYSWDRFIANPMMVFDLDDSARCHERFIQSRLTLVPKTWKGPRGVYISPTSAVFVQIGQDMALKEWCSRSWLRWCYDPVSQEPSRELAYMGSYGGHVATLDLSNASDRVPLSLINYLFHRQDYLALASTRPVYVWLPNGDKHKMAMLAPMGDGKTFSALTVVCAVISLAAILVAKGYLPARPPHIEVIESLAKRIRVFGDDIIVPTEYYSDVCTALEAHNLRVNIRKSFGSGHFRESCGMDAYKGVDVTPFRWKGAWKGEFASFDKIVGLRNSLFLKRPDLKRTVCYIDDYIHHRWPSIGCTTRCDLHPAMLQSDTYAVERQRWTRKLRFNSDIYQCQIYAPCGTRFRDRPRDSDSRWDLNYWLLPKGRRLEHLKSRWVTDNHSITGSPGLEDMYYAAINRNTSIVHGPAKSSWLGYSWQNLV